MLLLNLVRTIITLLGLVIIDAFRNAYDLSGLPLIIVLSIVLFVVFVVGDVAEDALIAHFNRDDEKSPA